MDKIKEDKIISIVKESYEEIDKILIKSTNELAVEEYLPTVLTILATITAGNILFFSKYTANTPEEILNFFHRSVKVQITK